MTSTTLSRPIPLHRPLPLRVLDFVNDRLTALHRHWQARRVAWAEWRRSAEAERDIGAPQGLIGQRRWQYEQEGRQIVRILQLHGW
jgi:hypothetical protein